MQSALLTDDVTKPEHTGPFKAIWRAKFFACLFTICAKLLQKRFVLLWEAKPVWSKGRMCTPCPVYLRHGGNFMVLISMTDKCKNKYRQQMLHDIKACATASETLFNNSGTWGIGAWFRGINEDASELWRGSGVSILQNKVTQGKETGKRLFIGHIKESSLKCISNRAT